MNPFALMMLNLACALAPKEGKVWLQDMRLEAAFVPDKLRFALAALGLALKFRFAAWKLNRPVGIAFASVAVAALATVLFVPRLMGNQNTSNAAMSLPVPSSESVQDIAAQRGISADAQVTVPAETETATQAEAETAQPQTQSQPGVIAEVQPTQTAEPALESETFDQATTQDGAGAVAETAPLEDTQTDTLGQSQEADAVAEVQATPEAAIDSATATLPATEDAETPSPQTEAEIAARAETQDPAGEVAEAPLAAVPPPAAITPTEPLAQEPLAALPAPTETISPNTDAASASEATTTTADAVPNADESANSSSAYIPEPTESTSALPSDQATANKEVLEEGRDSSADAAASSEIAPGTINTAPSATASAAKQTPVVTAPAPKTPSADTVVITTEVEGDSVVLELTGDALLTMYRDSDFAGTPRIHRYVKASDTFTFNVPFSLYTDNASGIKVTMDGSSFTLSEENEEQYRVFTKP